MNKVKMAIQLMSKKGNVCDVCNEDLSDGENYTLDHVIPKSYGGVDTVDNLEILCLRCNIGRRNRIGTRHFNIRARDLSEIISNKLKPQLISYEKRHGFINNEQIDEMIAYKNELIKQIENKFAEIEKIKDEPIEKLGRIGSITGKEKFLTSDIGLTYEQYKAQT